MKITTVVALYLISCSVAAQCIYVDVRVEKMSPFLHQYSKTEMEQMIRDSIALKLKRNTTRIKTERKITFSSSVQHEYVVELVLSDTVDVEAAEKFRSTRLATIHSRVYEKGLDTALMPELKWFAVGYSGRDGKLSAGKTANDVIGDYSIWTTVVFVSDRLMLIPYFNRYNLTQFNILQEDTKDYGNFREVLVIKTGFDDSVKTKPINRLLDDTLLRAQEFYYSTRSKKENYVNIYDREEEIFTDHPIKIELNLLRREKGYEVRLILDKGMTMQSPIYGYHVLTEFEFTDAQLEHAPSQVLSQFHDMFKTLFRLNLP